MDCSWSDLIPRLDVEPELTVDAVADNCDVGGNANVVDHGSVGVSDNALAIEYYGGVDWDNLQINDIIDEEGEGRQEIIDEDQLFSLLGLRTEDDEHRSQEQEASTERENRPENRDATIEEENGPENRNATFEGENGPENRNATIEEEIDITGAAIPVDDDVPGERIIVYDPNKPCMDIGTLYPNMKEFRLAMRQFAINEEFELRIVKSEPQRYIGDCNAEGCPWHIVGRRQPDGTTIKVTCLISLHTCFSSARRKTTTPTCGWVASKAIHYLKKNPNMGPKELQEELQDKHKCEIHYDTVQRGRNIALREIFGSWEESFQMLFNWRAEVLKRSPGSVIEIGLKEVDGKVYFHRFFCALSPCIDGFLEGCRPYLSIDSTALNGRWNGHLAAAVAVDGHHWMYPVAFGFIDGETIDNWTWFMTQLHKAIGNLPLLAICTDACKGLEKAVKDVFPNAEHRECFRHLMQNFIKRFGGDIFSKMYPAARTYRPEVFQYFFQQIVTACPDVLEWLHNHHKLLWMRSAFNQDIKCDYVTNNLAESFNNWIREWKDLPVVELADKIRQMIMVLWHKRRLISERLDGKILPAVLSILKARTRGLGNYTVVKAGCFAAEIHDTTSTHNRHVVKSYLHECTCLEWQHTGKPCRHALVLITAQQSADVKLEDFVHDYYSVQRFKNAYKRLIEPLPDKTQWPKVDIPFPIGAPLDKKGVGRYRKLRIKGCLEGGNGGKTKKVAKEAANEADKDAELEAAEAAKGKRQLIRGKRKCKRCGELGHGETSYKCRLNGTKKPPKRKARPNTTKYGQNAKVPTKRAKKQPENESGQALVVESDQALVVESDQALVVRSPTRTRETILQDSPNRLTRRQLSILMGEKTCAQPQSTNNLMGEGTSAPTKPTARKLIPRKKTT